MEATQQTIATSAFRLPALSIRQPWCHRILRDGKDVENRDWPTKFRGRVLIHASKGVDSEDKPDILAKGMPLGGIVGIMEIVDCVASMDSQWFMGKFGFVIRNACPLPLLPCKGALGFFRPQLSPAETETLNASLSNAYEAYKAARDGRDSREAARSPSTPSRAAMEE